MDISYNWLAQYVDHDLAPEALAEVLTMGGLEVEGIDRIGQSLDGVIVGQVLAVEAHPNADRLVLCDVDCGDDEPVQIACGADNVAAGQHVPVATPGTTLELPSRQNPTVYEPVTIETRTIRGETSHGMICAEDELGLSEDHAGIMVLDDAAEVGQAFTEYLAARSIESTDAVFDIGLTPNRPDAASHFGVARDAAALTGSTLTRPEVDRPEEGGDAADAVGVEIQAPEGCPRYVALLVRDVAVQESPTWLKRRLASIGLRPRNNVVDVTNFVLLLHEIGQPLHAFDFDTLADHRIVVRKTESEEPFTTLDDTERTLPAGTLLICDAERPVAIAGVMGGANSEVSEATTDVLIESAYFDPSTIRKTANALNLQTDSSYRFERGVDRDGQVWAAARAAELIAQLGGGTIVPGMVDAHPTPPEVRTVALRPDRLNALLGVDIPVSKAIFLLEQIGFAVARGEDDVLRCTVPTFRPDVEQEVDLIEEVARLYGYDHIPEPERVPLPSHLPRELRADRLRQQVSELLRGRGFREIQTNSMLRADRAARFNRPALTAPGDGALPIVETMNPISQEMATLRPSLLPGALEVMQHNRNHGQEALRFFEFGHVFHRSGPDAASVVPGFFEQETMLIALSGPHAPTHWDQAPREADFFDLKGTVASVLDALHIEAAEMVPATTDDALTTYQLDVLVAGAQVGTVARVDDAVADDFDLTAPAFVAELDWATLVDAADLHEERCYTPISRFPIVERDLAILADADAPVGPMMDTLRAEGAPLLQDVSVFDIYEGEGIPSGQKSVAFGLRFGADRTLKDQEVDALVKAMLTALKKHHGATLRQ
ncbi:MAG: phenylalanine--tRNA ligase subunit beta [Bacteroidetes bacterium]|jgi:phenylalanyl-tRNA synthetase beta chain|nr:phenylalanine--tRNA ligase subunit beta [Bacteroidota bacterium]